ncbi:unnamed protein product [Mytilus coruscus]|uniref:B box-type domain-containing protein n=1 Tax=Mytilus coruscus TaxID=42192 RepID=A0A6J8C3M9_MYTCO|nr:unnamed protein product [Mytilus coruscus]
MKPKEPISIEQMQIWIYNIVLILFPKMMQLLLQNLITPRGLLNKYNNRDLKVNLTETERSVMEKLPKMTEFTIELCYKIIRFENLVPEPSSQWEILPREDHKEITDDIKRIVFNTNDVINKQGNDVLNTSYETFKGNVKGIVTRIDLYLGIESCQQCYKEVILLDAQLDICLRELRKLREIDFISSTTPKPIKIEVQNGERFARIGWVIIDVFLKILRAVIHLKIAADVLYTHCSIPPYWSRFTYDEQSKLKSLNSSLTYDFLDIPLVYRLLRQFSLIKEPANGWGQPPSNSDITTADDVERIRFLRNNFAHRSNINTTQPEFDDTFATFKDICSRMDVYFSHDSLSGYENDVKRIETTPMDYQLIQSYQRSLQELENIKLRFIKSPVKFYWGENVVSTLKNLRQVYKDEQDKREGVTDSKLNLQIVIQNVKDENAISKLIHEEFKNEINTELTAIQLLRVTKGSIIFHVSILREAVYSEEKYTEMHCLCNSQQLRSVLTFKIERSVFETDIKLKSKLGETVTTMLKHSNGKGQISDVSATISSDGFGEIAFANPVIDKSETVEEITESGSDVKQNIHDNISLNPTLKMDRDRLYKSDFQTEIGVRDDSTSIQMVNMEIAVEGKYEEIVLNVENLKCLLKLKGIPNDLQNTEVDEKSPDIKGNQLLCVEWTMECPKTWNLIIIASTINDKLPAFRDEINVEYVYTETNSKLVIQTTTNKYIFRSLSSIEVVVEKFINSIMNVCSLKSSEPEELSVSALVMITTDDDEAEFSESEFIKEVKKDQSIIGLKDNFVTCKHCTTGFSCVKCTSKIYMIRRLNQSLRMKEHTIEIQKYQLLLRYKPEEETRKTSKTAEIELSEESEQKKRKTAITSDMEKSEHARKALNQNDSNIRVDVKQALQKLGEIPVVDYYIKIYDKYIRDLNNKWLSDRYQYYNCNQIRPKNQKAILDNLFKEKKKRTQSIAKLINVIQNQDEFTTTDEAYGTDLRFLDVKNPATKCNHCNTEETSKISCYCKNCEIIICDNCVKEHRMKNKKDEYLYLSKILREYKLTDSWRNNNSVIVDLKCMHADIVVILHLVKLYTYNLTGGLINTHTFRTSLVNNSRMACISDTKLAVTVPPCNKIHIINIVNTITTTDLETPEKANMTGGMTCRMDILYVAFTDAIRLMDLSGHIQRVINIPSIYILHSVNNDKMLCVYSTDNAGETVSCLDLTNGSVFDFERFPFHPKDVTTDEVGNIIFIVDGVIWKADQDGKNFKIIISPKCYNSFERLVYNIDSKILVTFQKNRYNEAVQLYRKQE